MTFNSIFFIFVFLPISLLAFYISQKLKKSFSIYCIIIFSILFYLENSFKYFPLLIFSLLINFFFSKFIKKNFFILLFLIFFNLSILFYYKFFNFFIDNSYTSIPLGISFYIFNQIAFVIDHYYSKIKNPSFINFFFIIIYFPHLIAGPFLRYSPIISQLKNNKYFNITYKKIFFGLLLFCAGLFKKIVLADSLGVYVDNFHLNVNNKTLDPEFFSAWIASIAFSLQLYFDFSGYSDMAIGLSFFFGIKLPINFDSPYKSTNIINFWKRWHTTLGKYIFEFIYIPLSVYSEKIFGKINHFIKNFFPVMITFIIIGLWHGSGRNNFETVKNFLIFGLLHGSFYYFNYIMKDYEFIKYKKIEKIISIFFTFNLVNISFVFFRSNNLESSILIIESMIGLNNFDIQYFVNNLGKFGYSSKGTALIFITLFIISMLTVFFGFNLNKFSQNFYFQKKIIQNNILSKIILIIFSLAAAISILCIKKDTPFLYINF
jgi:D-alanyl-lipoteichoic acid acyltransferase DltB (MBOAT superfamily)